MFVNHSPRSEYTVPMEMLGHCCLMSHQAGPPAGLWCQRLSVLSCALQGATLPPPPQSHLPTPQLLCKQMSLVPSMVCRQAASFPYDPVLCLEASGHRTDPAGQSVPGPQIQESCASRDAFGRGAAFGGTAPHPVVRKAGSTSH